MSGHAVVSSNDVRQIWGKLLSCKHCVFISRSSECLLYISQKFSETHDEKQANKLFLKLTAITSLNRINQLIFVMVKCSVLYEVGLNC
jgi:hypothetical protein